MSPLDPSHDTEPRGWDRPEGQPALPWPDRELQPGQFPARHPAPVPGRSAPPDSAGLPVPSGHAAPSGLPARSAPPVLSGPSAPAGLAVPPGPTGPPGPAASAGPPPPEGPAGPDFPARPEHPAGPGPHGPWGPPGPGQDQPTAEFAAIRPEPALTPEPEPGPDADPEAGRGGPGRRRASAERPATQPPRKSRAGRNLPAAIGVGLGLGALILVPLFLYPPAFLVVVAGAIGVGAWEMTRAYRRIGARPPAVPLVAGSVLTIGLAGWAGPDALTLGLLVTVLGTVIWRLGDGLAGLRKDLVAILLIAVYVPFLGGFAAMLAAAPGDGQWRVLVTIVAVVLSDTGGYAAGANFGKHKMVPSVSPSKTWEGLAGSMLAAALGSAVLIWLLFDVAPWWGALFGVAVSGAAVLGDLAESMMKRDIGVKDMSNLLPGHGGLMDRLDSVLFAVPTGYLILAVFVPVVS